VFIAESDRIALRAIDHVTHVGDFRGIAATHKRVTFPMMAMYRIENNKIAEMWEHMDTEGLLGALSV
jgi:predicted ester cyclase